jgi:hypothetical protein
MSSENPLERRNDLKGLYFFHFLPNCNIYKRKYLCTLIEKNLGVNYIILIYRQSLLLY